MGKWDENSGYYCLLIAIFCGLDPPTLPEDPQKENKNRI